MEYNKTVRGKYNNERAIRKENGVFFTPPWVVDYMISLIDEQHLTSKERLSILEPAAGMCQFLSGFKKNKPQLFQRASKKVAVDINGELLNRAREELVLYGVEFVCADYILWNTEDRFDVIIGNPPYGIPSQSHHYPIRVDNQTKERYKQTLTTWYGKYNMYGAFIEKSVNLLKDGGQLIFIVPSTFMILDEYRKLRTFLASAGETTIIYMGKNVFRPDADVATAILNFKKDSHARHRLRLLEHNGEEKKLISERQDWTGQPVLFASEFSKALEQYCSLRIGDVYSVHISLRTPEVRTNPHVLKRASVDSDDFLPLLNSKNLNPGRVDYVSTHGYWVKANNISKLRPFFSEPRIVMGMGFRGTRNIAAAYDYKAYPWYGEVYHLLIKQDLFGRSFDLEEEDVVNFLNSGLVKRYIKETFREITYHLSVSQIKHIPLPTKKELENIRRDLNDAQLDS
ncbi:MAG TPA: N-6 DNA methylase [Coprothermobacter sp.]|nr:N-6 DNA methylase [Coprothermobacter sp.]HQE50366.1 N-6 DNA methylase [Fervidobacterium sp.]